MFPSSFTTQGLFFHQVVRSYLRALTCTALSQTFPSTQTNTPERPEHVSVGIGVPSPFVSFLTICFPVKDNRVHVGYMTSPLSNISSFFLCFIPSKKSSGSVADCSRSYGRKEGQKKIGGTMMYRKRNE